MTLLVFITLGLVLVAAVVIGVLVKALAWLAVLGIVLLVVTCIAAALHAARGA